MDHYVHPRQSQFTPLSPTNRPVTFNDIPLMATSGLSGRVPVDHRGRKLPKSPSRARQSPIKQELSPSNLNYENEELSQEDLVREVLHNMKEHQSRMKQNRHQPKKRNERVVQKTTLPELKAGWRKKPSKQKYQEEHGHKLLGARKPQYPEQQSNDFVPVQYQHVFRAKDQQEPWHTSPRRYDYGPPIGIDARQKNQFHGFVNGMDDGTAGSGEFDVLIKGSWLQHSFSDATLDRALQDQDQIPSKFGANTFSRIFRSGGAEDQKSDVNALKRGFELDFNLPKPKGAYIKEYVDRNGPSEQPLYNTAAPPAQNFSLHAPASVAGPIFAQQEQATQQPHRSEETGFQEILHNIQNTLTPRQNGTFFPETSRLCGSPHVIHQDEVEQQNQARAYELQIMERVAELQRQIEHYQENRKDIDEGGYGDENVERQREPKKNQEKAKHEITAEIKSLIDKESEERASKLVKEQLRKQEEVLRQAEKVIQRAQKAEKEAQRNAERIAERAADYAVKRAAAELAATKKEVEVPTEKAEAPSPETSMMNYAVKHGKSISLYDQVVEINNMRKGDKAVSLYDKVAEMNQQTEITAEEQALLEAEILKELRHELWKQAADKKLLKKGKKSAEIRRRDPQMSSHLVQSKPVDQVKADLGLEISQLGELLAPKSNAHKSKKSTSSFGRKIFSRRRKGDSKEVKSDTGPEHKKTAENFYAYDWEQKSDENSLKKLTKVFRCFSEITRDKDMELFEDPVNPADYHMPQYMHDYTSANIQFRLNGESPANGATPVKDNDASFRTGDVGEIAMNVTNSSAEPVEPPSEANRWRRVEISGTGNDGSSAPPISRYITVTSSGDASLERGRQVQHQVARSGSKSGKSSSQSRPDHSKYVGESKRIASSNEEGEKLKSTGKSQALPSFLADKDEKILSGQEGYQEEPMIEFLEVQYISRSSHSTDSKGLDSRGSF